MNRNSRQLRTARRAAIAACAWTCACAAPEGSPWAEDADFSVEVGTGREAFVALSAGDPLPLERGAQGLQHVIVSARVALDEGMFPVETWLVVDDEVVSSPSRVNTPLVAAGDSVETLGRNLVIPDVSVLVGADAELRVEIVDGDRIGRGAISGPLTWTDPP